MAGCLTGSKTATQPGIARKGVAHLHMVGTHAQVLQHGCAWLVALHSVLAQELQRLACSISWASVLATLLWLCLSGRRVWCARTQQQRTGELAGGCRGRQAQREVLLSQGAGQAQPLLPFSQAWPNFSHFGRCCTRPLDRGQLSRASAHHHPIGPLKLVVSTKIVHLSTKEQVRQ